MHIVCISTGNSWSLLDQFFRHFSREDMIALEKSKAGRSYGWAGDEGWVAEARQMALTDQDGYIPALTTILSQMRATDAAWVSYGEYTQCLCACHSNV